VTAGWSSGDAASAAGASARAEFERKSNKHRERRRASQPRHRATAATGAALSVAIMLYSPMWGLVAILIVLVYAMRIMLIPDNAMSWAIGANGEAATARVLEPLKSEGFVILHDRKIPGSSANIDHIVIGPPGVAIVETKSYSRRVRIRGDEVYVGGYLKTGQTVQEAIREALAVTVALADDLERRSLKVRPILCIHRADLPFLGASPQGVLIVDGRGLVKTLRAAPQRLSAQDVQVLARLANDRLRPAAAPPSGPNTPVASHASSPNPAVRSEPSLGAADGDISYLPPIRREQLRLAGEARARATDERTYWTPRGLAEGKAPPTRPREDPSGRSV